MNIFSVVTLTASLVKIGEVEKMRNSLDWITQGIYSLVDQINQINAS